MRRTVVRHRGYRVPPSTHAVLVLIVGVVVTACSAGSVQASADQVAQQPATVEAPADGCPAITPNEPDATTAVAVDYVDFVTLGRTMYIAGLQPVTETELDEIVMTSQCSYRELNDRIRRHTPTPGNGDTAFLPPGTPVYALRGWSPSCWLAAAHDGELHVYLAQQDGGTHAPPTACAVG